MGLSGLQEFSGPSKVPRPQWPGEGVTGVTDLQGPGPKRAPGGPKKTKLHALKGGPGRPNHALQKGPGKWYMAVSRLILGQTLGNVRGPK
jgi:hypothetical protein